MPSTPPCCCRSPTCCTANPCNRSAATPPVCCRAPRRRPSLTSDLCAAQSTQKSMLCTWSKLYKVFARCSALVITAEENVCCEELCVKLRPVLDKMDLQVSGRIGRSRHDGAQRCSLVQHLLRHHELQGNGSKQRRQSDRCQ